MKVFKNILIIIFHIVVYDKIIIVFIDFDFWFMDVEICYIQLEYNKSQNP